MKFVHRFLALLSFASVAASVTAPFAQAQEGNSFWSEPRRAQIWSVITVHEGADLHQLQETMSQTRDEVRDKLWDQLSSLAPQLMTPATDGAKLARGLAGILLSFDRMHAMHKAEDKVNFDKTLSVQLQSGFERFMKTYHIADSMRRAEFINPSASSLQFLLQSQGARSNVQLLEPAVLSQRGSGIDYVIALTWSGVGPQVQIALSVERIIATPLPNGALEVITKPTIVTVTGPWATAGEQAGFVLAQLFQTIDPVTPVNPNPTSLKWITHFVEDFAKPMSHREATNICRSQNARLPYADELLLAEKMNAFYPGGINTLSEAAYFAVADKQREEGQVYFLNKSFASSPTGMVVSEIGLGPTKGYVFCVIGEPAEAVKSRQSMYTMLRAAKARGDQDSVDALEYLLIKAEDLGREPVDSYRGQKILAKYGSYLLQEIVDRLLKRGYPINPAALDL